MVWTRRRRLRCTGTISTRRSATPPEPGWLDSLGGDMNVHLTFAGWKRPTVPQLAKLSVVVGMALVAPLRPALAEERCGWLENPTPGNWWLKDAHGLWIISAQGGPYADGVEK